MPNQPKTPTHNIRVEAALWRAVMEKAHERGETATDVAVRAFRRYVKT